MAMLRGNQLTAAQQHEVKAAYVHRYTGEHKPQWANRPDCAHCPVQFKDDAEWLANTRFFVTESGELSRRHCYCESSPTWPNNPELRKEATK